MAKPKIRSLRPGWGNKIMSRTLSAARDEVVDAIDEELRIASRFVKFRISDVSQQGGIWKLFVEPVNASSALDESLEGAGARWAGPPSGAADVLSVIPDTNQLNIRFLNAPPPGKGQEIRVYPPRYLEAPKSLSAMLLAMSFTRARSPWPKTASWIHDGVPRGWCETWNRWDGETSTCTSVIRRACLTSDTAVRYGLNPRILSAIWWCDFLRIYPRIKLWFFVRIVHNEAFEE
jgi:hypothetical protein